MGRLLAVMVLIFLLSEGKERVDNYYTAYFGAIQQNLLGRARTNKNRRHPIFWTKAFGEGRGDYKWHKSIPLTCPPELFHSTSPFAGR
jgi:hypothetical protein